MKYLLAFIGITAIIGLAATHFNLPILSEAGLPKYEDSVPSHSNGRVLSEADIKNFVVF
jgi:hypothetical protein